MLGTLFSFKFLIYIGAVPREASRGRTYQANSELESEKECKFFHGIFVSLLKIPIVWPLQAINFTFKAHFF